MKIDAVDSESVDARNDTDFSIDDEAQLESNRESLNATFDEHDLSPLKVHSVSSHSMPSLGKRRLKQVEGVFTKKLASALRNLSLPYVLM